MPAPSPALRVIAWPRWARPLAAALTALCFANLLFVATLLVLDSIEGELRAPPAGVTFAVLYLSVLPRAVVAALRWLFSATLRGEADRWIVEGRFVRFELPTASLAELSAWRLPLPGPGFALRLASGRRFTRTFEGALPDFAPPLSGRAAAFAVARATLHRRDARAWLFKYALFPLLPIAVLFRTHQVITFGAPLGQWSLMGPGPFFRSLLEHGAATLAHLVVIAGVARVLAEAVALTCAALSPGSANRARRIAEWFARLSYYVAIPLLIGIAFLL